MKRKIPIIGLVLSFAITLSTIGQTDKGSMSMADTKKSDMMSKPTFKATTAGIQIKVWVMVREGEIKENDMSSAKATNEGMMSGTYHVIVELKNADNGKKTEDVSASLLAVSPASKSSSVELKPMMDQLVGNIALDEKGEYDLTVSLSVAGVTNTTPFKFTAK